MYEIFFIYSAEYFGVNINSSEQIFSITSLETISRNQGKSIITES